MLKRRLLSLLRRRRKEEKEKEEELSSETVRELIVLVERFRANRKGGDKEEDEF